MSEYDQRSRCTCYVVGEHEGNDATAYITAHLEKVAVDAERWTIEYRCPLYGKRWLSDQPWGEMHGGGPVRLRTFDRVCRDVKNSLFAVNALLPTKDVDGHESDDCQLWRGNFSSARGSMQRVIRSGDSAATK